MSKYPRICDLEAAAKRRIPGFAWAYLHSGTGHNRLRDRNQTVFEGVNLTPRVLRGQVQPEIKTDILGQEFSMPVGMSPIGLTSMIWPGAELMMARAARGARVPITLSTVAGESIEAVGAAADGYGWYQLYPPKDKSVRADLLKRAGNCGYRTLMVTVDVPGQSRREEMLMAGAAVGSRSKSGITPRIIWQSMQCPSWSLGTLRAGGKMRFKTLERYVSGENLGDVATYIGEQLNGGHDWDVIDDIRSRWSGPMIVKGVLHQADALELQRRGVDGIVVSNHGGRQMDGGPTSLQQLPILRKAVGKDMFLALDSGVRSGLDVVRAMALGADFVMLGRPFLYGAGALGARGPAHVLAILEEEITNVMVQLGVEKLSQLADCLTE